MRKGSIASRRLATDQAVLTAALRLKPHKVLDLGCGEGWLSHQLSALGCELTGIDAAANLIALAREGPGHFLQLSYAEFAQQPQRCGQGFDLVIANFSLLQAELLPVLRACWQCLLPTGHLLVQTLHPWSAGPPYQEGWRQETFSAFAETISDGSASEGPAAWQPMPWYFRTLGSWLQLFQAAGFALHTLHEPTHPDNQQPLSLLLLLRKTDPLPDGEAW